MDVMTRETSLYKGDITILFDEKARNRYVVKETGKSPVGVTTVLGVLNKPALMTWPMYEAITYIREHAKKEPIEALLTNASKAYLKKGDKGKDTGKEAHGFFEQFLLHKDKEKFNYDGASPEAAQAITAFLRWYKENNPRIIGIEQIVYSKQNDYAGTFDCLLEIDGQTILCDWKTTNASKTAPKGIYSEYFLQLGAYSLAYEEDKLTSNISDLMVINCSKTGVLSTLRASELGLRVRDCEDMWLNVLKTYKFLQPLNKIIGEV